MHPYSTDLVVLSGCLSSNTHPTCTLRASVSFVYSLLAFGSASVGVVSKFLEVCALHAARRLSSHKNDFADLFSAPS